MGQPNEEKRLIFPLRAELRRELTAVNDADFSKQVAYPDWDPLLSGDVTMERLFRYVKVQFDAHAEQIRASVGQLPPASG